MKKRMLSILCVLMTLMLAMPAVAEPIITSSLGYTAYLGETNFLYLTGPDGVTKVLQTPIADLIGMNEEYLYCTTSDGRRYEVKLDGSASRVMTEDPLLSDAYILEEGILNINSATDGVLSGIPNVEAACVTASWLYYVTPNGLGGYALMGIPLPITTGTVPAAQVVYPLVSKPLTVTASNDAVVIITENQAAEIIMPDTQQKESVSLIGQNVTHAFLFNGKLVTLQQQENGHFTVVSATDFSIPDPLSFLTPVPTSAPTATVTAKPTATPKVTATPKPASSNTTEDDGRISKGDTGSAVRKMQRRLAELGYPVGNVDGDFGENTLLAVNLFQCAIGYRNRSYASSKMLDRLYSRNAPKYDPYAPLKEGDEGADVEIMQTFLHNLGYSVGEKGIDGKFGKDTKAAVEQFQFVAGLEVTGEADAETLKLLYDPEHPIPNATPTPVPTETPAPTDVPTQEPTQAPTEAPTEAPTQEPTESPTQEPTQAPTEEPTEEPTQEPTQAPTEAPTEEPTQEPTEAPTEEPTQEPTQAPTDAPAPDPDDGIATPTDLQ
ncbi:MAG: peptidoglycan-binding protein [Clostridia bacterium]|nr:peptidoglycan-binding protein [Clostridia bacterium]